MPELLSRPSAGSIIKLRALNVEQLHGILLLRWRELSDSCPEPNTFLSPDFILPYLKHFPRQSPPLLLTGEDSATGKLIGLGVFETSNATKALPLPHLVPFRCKHQFRDGLLVAADQHDQFYDALLTYLSEEQEEWFGIEFRNLILDSHWARRLRNHAIGYGCSFRLTPRYQSPAVQLHDLQNQDLASRWSSSRRKTMRRNRNKLEKLGPVSFRVVSQEPQLWPSLQQFLQLEQSGWKGDLGTSLLSEQTDFHFIQEMVLQYAKAGNLMISELLVGDEVAASAINLKAGNQFYAFKIGWNDKFADASPGVLHEAELIAALQRDYPSLKLADSCAQADSYLKNLWPDQLTIGDGLLAITTLARGTGKLISKLRHFKRWASDKLRSDDAEGTKADA